MILIDIETRATLSVTDVGLYAHAPTAKVLLMWYKIDDGDWTEWRGFFADGVTPYCSDDPPEDLIEAVRDGHKLYAFNAAYERVVLNQQPWCPMIRIEQTVCLAAWCRMFNLPNTLWQVTNEWLGEGEGKTSPTNSKYLWDANIPFRDSSPDDMDEQSDYCLRDCTSMEGMMDLLPDVDPDWLRVYHVNERINERGVFIDEDLAKSIVALRPSVERDLLDKLEAATDGRVTKIRGPQMLNWLRDILPEELEKALEITEKYKVGYNFKSRKKFSAGKKARKQLYDALDEYEGDFDSTQLTRALIAFEEANKAAVYKFASALKSSVHGLLQGQFVMNGASQTTRFSSYGVQVHNLKRDVAEDVDKVVRLFLSAADRFEIQEILGMSVNEAASEVLRPMFMAEEDSTLWWGDWSSVEARGLPWLSADPRAEPLLDAFRRGEDVYVNQAAVIYDKAPEHVTKDERQAGKVAVLALGYQGGVNAYQAMASGYGVEVTDAEANKIKNGWREANPWAVDFWYALERAAMDAIESPGHMIPCGRIHYQFVPDLLRGTLLCWLPDGRWIAYPDARIEQVEKFDGEVIEDALVYLDPVFGLTSTYGGQLCENITQAVCAGLLWNALVELDREQVPVVLHVHDEIVVDSPDPEDGELLNEIMNEVPEWAEGFPIDADVERGNRYKVPDKTAAE